MSDGVEFKLTGAEALQRKLHNFAPKFQRKGLRTAARKAMQPVRRAARANARAVDDPDTANHIWKLITLRAGRMREPGVIMRVGVIGGAVSSESKQPPWYWRLVELGTETMRAQPFMRPALDNNYAAVADTFVREANAELDKLAAGGG